MIREQERRSTRHLPRSGSTISLKSVKATEVILAVDDWPGGYGVDWLIGASRSPSGRA